VVVVVVVVVVVAVDVVVVDVGEDVGTAGARVFVVKAGEAASAGGDHTAGANGPKVGTCPYPRPCPCPCPTTAAGCPSSEAAPASSRASAPLT